MKRSIQRLSFFGLAVAAGAVAFGLFWSAQSQARSSGGAGGTYCDQNNPATMCKDGATVTNVPPTTQATYLANGQATCGPCPTSPN